MSQIQKPSSLNIIWADQGAKIKPEDSKILLGWVAEIPPHQFFNWSENRRDTAIAHINQHGIPVWDALTDYLKDKSYVQGPNGKIYRALLDNKDRDPAANPVHWKEAFLTSDDGTANALFIGYSVQSTGFTAQPNTRYYLTNPVDVYLPATASNGATVTLNKKPMIVPRVYAPSGSQIVTPLGADTEILYDLNDELNFVYNGVTWEVI